MRRLLITDHPWPGTEVEEDLLAEQDIEIIDAPAGDEATLISLAKDADAIATCWAKVTAQVIEAAPQCRVISRLGIGLDNIDVQAATAAGIPVTNVPDYCVEEVADHACGLLLGLCRNIGFYHRQTKSGIYDLPAGPPMHRLRGRRLGLIGLGRIGRAMYERAQAFGLHVSAHTPSGNSHGTGCEMVDLDELLQTSDFISLHAPLTPATRHLLDAQAFDKMRQGVFLINTSRGPLIDPEALWQAIQAGQVAGAGLDVFEPEPPPLEAPLYQDERVIVTPHAAFVSEEAIIDLRQRATRQIIQALSGQRPENVVNDV